MTPCRALMIGLVVCLVWWNEPVQSEEDGSQALASPQAVFDTASAAVKKGDWKAFHGCLTKSSAEEFTGQLAFFGLILRGFADADKTGKMKKALKPVQVTFERHGLTKEVLDKVQAEEQKATKESKEANVGLRLLAARVKDPGAFCGEMMKVMREVGQQGEKSVFEDATLKNLKVDGDKATGTAVSRSGGGKEKEETLTFVKTDGGWRIELPRAKIMAARKK